MQALFYLLLALGFAFRGAQADVLVQAEVNLDAVNEEGVSATELAGDDLQFEHLNRRLDEHEYEYDWTDDEDWSHGSDENWNDPAILAVIVEEQLRRNSWVNCEMRDKHMLYQSNKFRP